MGISNRISSEIRGNFLSISIALLTALALFAVQGKARAEYQALERVIAIVEEEVILQSEMDEKLETIKTDLINANQTLPPEDVLEKHVLEQLIMETIQLQMADKQGIRVSDSTLNDTMEKIAAQNGKSLPDFKDFIEAEGLEYRDIREATRKNLILSRLRQKMVANRINITEQDVKNYLNSPEGKERLSAAYRLGHVLVQDEEKANELYKKLKSGEEFFKTARQYGNASDLGLRKLDQIPTVLVEPVQKLDLGKTAKPIKSPSGYHVVQVLEKEGGDHKIVNQTHVRHILLKPNEIRTKENTKHLIDDIRLQIISGKNFAEMARTYSEDPISATDGGDLGWSNQGDFVPAFESAMKETKIGEMSKPFYSDYGWHILEVIDRRQHNVGKEHQLDQARGILQQKQFEDEIKLWLREIRQDSFVEIKLPSYQQDEESNNDSKS